MTAKMFFLQWLFFSLSQQKTSSHQINHFPMQNQHIWHLCTFLWSSFLMSGSGFSTVFSNVLQNLGDFDWNWVFGLKHWNYSVCRLGILTCKLSKFLNLLFFQFSFWKFRLRSGCFYTFTVILKFRLQVGCFWTFLRFQT
jgi:hypothetical protein